MGRQPGWMVTRTGRPAMRPPGRPPGRRGLERVFWVKVAEGLSSEDAAVACGVSVTATARCPGTDTSPRPPPNAATCGSDDVNRQRPMTRW